MKYCHKCGYSLSTEKFCPQCGIKLKQNEVNNEGNNIDITDNTVDLINTGFQGGGSIIDKKIDYRVQGNVVYLRALGDKSPSFKETTKVDVYFHPIRPHYHKELNPHG